VYKVFIDGQAGTTGLRLEQRLTERADIGLIAIKEELRKDEEARLERIAEADIVFLCLPDKEAADIAAAAADAASCRIIDCSTAHRTAGGWAYGMPEITGDISGFTRLSNPGCHATGFIMSVRPLIDSGLIDPGAAICFHSVTGYSGGGKTMVEEYESSGDALKAPRQYALAQDHKHLPEMLKYSGLDTAPVFSPIVCDFYCGMLVSVPLPRSAIRSGATAETIREALAARYYGCPLVKVRAAGHEFSEAAGNGYLSGDAFAGRDDIEIFVTGKDDRIDIVSRYDNLGKGASGAAIQSMNILFGLPEETGLVLGA